MTKQDILDFNKKVLSTGFPVCDSFSSIMGPLVTKYEPENSRTRIYPLDVAASCMIHQVMTGGASLRSAIEYNNSIRIFKGHHPASLNTGAYSDARSKVPLGFLKEMSEALTKTSEADVGQDFVWNGFRVRTIDGTTITLSDSVKNQEKYPQHSSQKDGAGFPIIRLVIMQSLVTSMIMGVSYGAYKGKNTGEMALARELLNHLSEGDLLLGDRYYPSYFLMAFLRKNNIEGVFQSHAGRNIDFREGKKLGPKDHIVAWRKPQKPSWMTEEEYRNYPDELKVREIDLSKKLSGKKRMVVVTTLLDEAKYKPKQLSSLYKRRWRIELSLRELKTVMGMEHIEANNPEMVEKIIHSYVLAYNLVRWHMLNIAILAERSVESISFKTSLDIIVKNTLNVIKPMSETDRLKLFAKLYSQIVSVRVGNRPGRIEPRQVKRRPKPHERLNQPRSQWKEENAHS